MDWSACRSRAGTYYEMVLSFFERELGIGCRRRQSSRAIDRGSAIVASQPTADSLVSAARIIGDPLEQPDLSAPSVPIERLAAIARLEARHEPQIEQDAPMRDTACS